MNAVLRPAEPQFRPMCELDVDEIFAIEQRAYAHPWTRGNFTDSLECGYSCWVLELDQAIIGYSILMSGAGEGHVLNCCISPDYQGRGFGRLLMQRLMADAPDFGVDCIFLEVRPSNASGIALYEKLGFETVGLRRNYYPAGTSREDALIMRRCLSTQA